MDKKQMYVEVVNLETGKVFSLPTLYTDRTEACVCGQNYVRDRQAEDRCSLLFFRVMISYDGKVADSFNIYDDEEDDDCGSECECYNLCYEDENEEDSEEPDYEAMY